MSSLSSGAAPRRPLRGLKVPVSRRDVVLLPAVAAAGLGVEVLLIATSPAEFSHAPDESPYEVLEFPVLLGLSFLLGFLRPRGPLWLDVVLVQALPPWVVRLVWAQVSHADFNDPILWIPGLVLIAGVFAATNFVGRGTRRLISHLLRRKHRDSRLRQRAGGP